MQKITFPSFPFDMVKIQTLGTENSCYFHAILQAFYKDYIEAKSIPEKTRITRILRNLLASQLQSTNENGEIVYNTLSRGQLKEYSKNVSSVTEEWTEDYSLQGMIKTLKGNAMMGESCHELLSNYLGIDIYILSYRHKDIYPITHHELYIKDRDSVVILIEDNHYSTIGINSKNEIQTFFSPTHEFIKFLKQRTLDKERKEK